MISEEEIQLDYNVLDGKKVLFHTLGCKLNFAETSTLGEMMLSYGAKRAAKGEQADICVVNTCTVTAIADSKCRQAIKKLIKENPGAIMAVTGCYAQLQPATISQIDGVDVVVGAQRRNDFLPLIVKCLQQVDKYASQRVNESTSPAQSSTLIGTGEGQEKVSSFFPSCSRGDRTRYFLKVQDGCNYFCTYCTIPMARGRSRNGSIESLVRQAQQVAEQGGHEIVITGVNIGDFGRSTHESFLDLVKALDEVEGIDRYRISSIEPNLLTDEIIDFLSTSRAFMPHFHIPLQSGSDEVLRLMHRHYDTALFRHKVELIHQKMPDSFIGVDVMTGTRGETAQLFEDAYKFIDSLDVSQLHVFTYSERPGTKALEIPHVVSPQEKHERTLRLLELSDRKTHEFYERYIGSVRPVLLEHSSRRDKPMHGFTDNYIRVELTNSANCHHPIADNRIVNLRLGQFNQKGDALCVD